MKARYLNPFTAPTGHDHFGFKKLFGAEASKPVLMDFLNALLPLEFGWAMDAFKGKNENLH